MLRQELAQNQDGEILIEAHNFEERLNIDLKKEPLQKQKNLHFSFLGKKNRDKIITLYAQHDYDKDTECQKLRISNSFLVQEDLSKLFANKFFSQNLLHLDLSSNSSTVSISLVEGLGHITLAQKLLSLSLKNNKQLDDNVCRVLHDLEIFSELRSLNLENCDISDLGLQVLAESAFAKKLEKLNISKNHSIQKLDALRAMSVLIILELNFCPVLQQLGLLRIIEFCDNLRYLDLSNCFLQSGKDLEEVLTTLANSHKLGFLETLYISDNQPLQNLRNLDISGNVSLFQDFKESETLPVFANLLNLSVRQCSVRARHIPFLLRCFPALRLLDLSQNELCDDGIEALLNSVQKENATLQKLGIGECQLTSVSLERLSRCPQLAALRFLYARQNQFGEEGVQSLTAQQNQQVLLLGSALEYLNLSDCGLTRASFEALFIWDGLRNVRDLRLSENVRKSSGAEILDLLALHIERLPQLQQVTLGSALDGLDEEVQIAHSLLEQKVKVLPFCCDLLD